MCVDTLHKGDDDDNNNNNNNNIQRMRNVKAKVLPFILGATGTISKSHREYLSNVLGKHEIKELQEQPRCVPHTDCGKC
jgi:hypothetical protein